MSGSAQTPSAPARDGVRPSCCSTHAPTAADRVATVTDPVCGMQVDPATTAHHAAHAGENYHFCSARCREKFVSEPERYLSPREAVAAPPGR